MSSELPRTLMCGALSLGRTLGNAAGYLYELPLPIAVSSGDACSGRGRLTWCTPLQNSFHGRTFGAMALTTSKTYYRQGFAPLMPQVMVAPYPYCLHCKVRQAHPEGDSWYKASLCTISLSSGSQSGYSTSTQGCSVDTSFSQSASRSGVAEHSVLLVPRPRVCKSLFKSAPLLHWVICRGSVVEMGFKLLYCTLQIQPNVNPYDPYTARTCCNGPMESLKWILKQQSAPSETAAIIVEPIMGEGGFLTPPPSFLPTLRKICDEHGIVLIIDEVRRLPCLQHDKTWLAQLCIAFCMDPRRQIVFDGLAEYLQFMHRPSASISSMFCSPLRSGEGLAGGNVLAAAGSDKVYMAHRCKRAWPEQASGGATSTSAGRLWSPTSSSSPRASPQAFPSPVRLCRRSPSEHARLPPACNRPHPEDIPQGLHSGELVQQGTMLFAGPALCFSI